MPQGGKADHAGMMLRVQVGLLLWLCYVGTLVCYVGGLWYERAKSRAHL